MRAEITVKNKTTFIRVLSDESNIIVGPIFGCLEFFSTTASK